MMHRFDALDAYICCWLVAVGIVFPALYLLAGAVRGRLDAAARRRARSGRPVNLSRRAL